MTTKNLILIFTSFLALSCGQKGNLGVSSGSILNGSRITHTNPTNSFNVAIRTGNLEIAYDKDFPCSGVIISQSAVLTAAHCLSEDGLQADNIQVVLGHTFSMLRNEKVTINAKAFHIHPKFDNTIPSPFDIAIIELEKEIPSGFAPIPLYDGKILNGPTPVESYGFSVHTQNSNANLFDLYDKRKSPFKNSNLSSSYSISLHAKATLLYWDNQVPLLTIQSGCKGDSGGGTIINVDGEKILLGLHIASKNQCAGFSYVIPVTPYLEWIKSRIENTETLVRKFDEKLSYSSFPKEYTSCLAIFHNTFMAMNESFLKGEICQMEGVDELLSDTIEDSKNACKSELSTFYPTFFANTLSIYKKKCAL